MKLFKSKFEKECYKLNKYFRERTKEIEKYRKELRNDFCGEVKEDVFRNPYVEWLEDRYINLLFQFNEMNKERIEKITKEFMKEGSDGTL